ncbi:MAG: hypothetical protein ACYC4I_02300 [Minisyncoccota bacterium]
MKKKNLPQQNTFTEFVLYTTPNGKVKVGSLNKNQLVSFWNILRNTSSRALLESARTPRTLCGEDEWPKSHLCGGGRILVQLDREVKRVLGDG